MTKRTYKNKQLTVHWDSEKCRHSGNCINGLPEVFDIERQPWIDIDAAEVETVKRVIRNCPSGALTYIESKDNA